ncbi:hypothetical protein [Nocardia altamirensis]|uniref:hypothetical protein n=1 Tax=Nocardia altamirensis TaxID=472158 RepID=UPI00114C911F|nr:hypothetical protein [Nocardia altamirensis]
MTKQTLVVVYAVDGAGATGERLGAGTLIESDFVLVHPLLNQALAAQQRPVRVGVFAAEHDITEVIDVAQVRVVPDAPELVFLELAVASRAPEHGLPLTLVDEEFGIERFHMPTNDEIVAAVRQVLADVPPPPPAPHDPFAELIAEAGLPPGAGGEPVEDPIRWIRRLFGGG